MTIVFQGHVQRIDYWGHGTLRVQVDAEKSICPEPIYLFVPEGKRDHWLIGRCVSITAYCFDAPKTEPDGGAKP